MKELSIEQKAKRYDEAIERAKKWYNAPNVDKIPTFGNRVIEEIFPELKESEGENADEKVRKALIKLVTNHASMDLFIEYDIHLDEALSWLEKQGNNMGISEDTKQKLEDNLNKALEKETPESWNEFLDEQGEHKPWSEEDEKIANSIWDSIDKSVLANYDVDEDKAFEWLKSLKDRIQPQPQPKQEKFTLHVSTDSKRKDVK